MAVATSAHGHAHNPLAMKRAGLWLFFFSEAFLFALLLSGRFFLEGVRGEHLNQSLGLAITIVLVMSSVTAYTAEAAIEHNQRKVFLVSLVFTILLGIFFAVGVAIEWSEAEFSRHEGFGTVFFTMTGIHASHVVSGMGLLVLVLLQALRGRYSSKDHWPVSGVIMYWHFVDVVWMFYYPALYLLPGSW